MSLCDKCISDKSLCVKCKDNPIYADVPKFSQFREYIPTCPRGYGDCVWDPAYIKLNSPGWYKDLYGDMTPEEASLVSCQKKVEKDPNEDYYCYDDEDK